MTRFTPGEWQVADRGGTRQAIIVQLPEHEHIDNVAVAYAPRYGRADDEDRHLDEYEANASLIAAAPNLFAALQAAIAAMNKSIEVGHTDHLDIDGDYWQDALEAAVAALAKAEGRA